ncbi:hypothetical protein ACP4OV_027384 [Aristida adscensionis]
MPRRGRRLGVRFIENEKERSLTFFKRRSGLYKAATDLSTLTGARIAVVSESENGKISSFGTPSVEPIVDTFLSGYIAVGPLADKEQKAKITILQNKLFKLEKKKAVQDKRNKEAMARVKEVQESSSIGKLIFNKEAEDIDTSELYELRRELSLIKQEIENRSPRLHQSNQVGVGVPRDPSFQQSSWAHQLPSWIPPPQKYSPWTPFQPSVELHEPSWSHVMKIRSQSLIPTTPPSTHQFNYHIWGIDNNGNNSNSFLPSPGQSPSPQFSLPQPLDSQLPHLSAQNNNRVEPPQNYVEQINFDSRNTCDNGGQGNGGHMMLSFSGLLQGDGWGGVNSNSSFPGESSGGVDVRNSFGDVSFPLY